MAKAKTEVAKAKSSLTGVKLAKSKKSLPAEVPEEMFFALANLYSEVAAIEKKVKLSSDGFERYATRISTGCLALDMYLDGGLVPGGWYTFSGGEQSCKSTLAMTVMASCIKSMTSGLTFVFDYEGSSDPIYIKNILKTFRMEIEEIQIFGLQDEETGEYIIKPKIKYYAPDTGTKFFDFMAMMRRRLPDKIVQKDGTAYLLYPNTKPNAKLCAGKYDKRHFSQHNEFKVAAPDGGMQVLVIVDSFPAMLPDLQDDDEASAAMAIQARMFSDGIKRFRGGMRRKLITILGVNQLRQKPAVMYGDPAYEPCGDALKFYCYGPDTYIHSSTHGLIQAKDTLGLTGAQFESISGQAPVEATFKVGEDKVQLAYFVTSGNSKITVRPGHAFYALQRRKIDPSVAVEGSSLVAFDHSWTDVAKLHAGDFLLSRVEDCAVDLDADGRYKYTAHTYCTTKGTALPDEVRMLQPQALYEFCRSVIDQFGYSAVKGEHNVCRIKSQNTSELAELLRAAGLVVLARHSMYIDVLHLNTSLNPFSQAHRELATAACWYDFIEEMDSGLANLLRADMATNARIKRFTVAAMDACVDDAAINGTISSELHDRYSTVLGYVSDIQEDLGMNVVPQMLYPKYLNSIKPCRTRIQFYDCNVPNSESVVANGLVGHNSDVRIRLQSRAIPQGWKGEAGIVSEPSVEYEEGIDQYRFIHAKTIKNKLGGIPNQQTWLRLWQADGNGDARGFDPVYDTWHFLKNLNLVVGTRASIKFTDTTPFGGSKAITWEEFRVLINGDKKQIQKVCDKMGVKKAGRIRNWCFEYLATPKGKQAVRDSIVKAVKTKKSEDEE